MMARSPSRQRVGDCFLFFMNERLTHRERKQNTNQKRSISSQSLFVFKSIETGLYDILK